MRLPQIRCSCSEIILKSTEEGESKIRSKVLVIKGESVFAVCKGCNAEVELPLKVDNEAANPPLFIKGYKK